MEESGFEVADRPLRATPWFLLAVLELAILFIGAALVFWVMR